MEQDVNRKGKNRLNDKMIPYSFEELLTQYQREYQYGKTIAGIPVVVNTELLPIGPAAGPHTQLAGNLVAAYVAGATYMELKTVQVLEGEALGIQKPCIYAGHEVFNTEWSTELTVEQASTEYIKAYLLMQVLEKECSLTPVKDIHFICSVGYDLAGIQSPKVDNFLNQMKWAGDTAEWKKDIHYLRTHMQTFEKFSLQDLAEIEKNACICDTVTLSTMHGCKAEEIGDIVKYLIGKKGFHTYVKMNPTLIGIEETRRIWKKKGYTDLVCREEIFAQDISLDNAAELIADCSVYAKKMGLTFGVKMTNTFPVANVNGELAGDTMYLSGKALYPLSVKAAALLAEKVKERGITLSISYSGGADANNIRALLQTGMKPITVSSLLLQPGGYKNISRLLGIAKNEETSFPQSIDTEALHQLALQAEKDTNYDFKETRIFATKDTYDNLCATCFQCADICPNRANVRVKGKDRDYVLHIDRLCNACGCCTQHCILGHKPYLEKYTVYENSDNNIDEKMQELLTLAIEQGKIEKRLYMGFEIVSNEKNKQAQKPDTSFLGLETAKKVNEYHKSFPMYEETPLRELSGLAAKLGVKDIYVKDESFRFGLNAFKVLGGSYAIGSYIAKLLHKDIKELPYDKMVSEEIRKELGDVTFISATDGNHGRGVAWTANQLKQKSVIYMPKGSAAERLANIRAEGADASITEYNYDDAVRLADKDAKEKGWVLVQDTSWDGYEEIPTHIMQGYTTLAYEIYQQLGQKKPTHVFLQAGVGSFASAVTGFLANVYGDDKPVITIVEPNAAACIYKTMKAADGNIHSVTGDMNTIMAGLACGEPVTVGINILRNYAEYFVSCPDYVAADGMRVLSSPVSGDERIISGESGAAAFGFGYELLTDAKLSDWKKMLGIDKDSVLLFISTEGDTDKENYEKIIWNGAYTKEEK